MDDFQRNAVKQMLDYIEAHLSSQISLYQLAQASGYSAWHAARLFKEATGTSPFSYIRSRRLAAAAHQLGVGKQRVIDVAMEFVFDSHEGFTRAFTKQFGMNPSDFRKTLAVYHARTVQLTISEGETCMDTVFVQVIDRMERKVVVKFAHKASDYFAYCEEVGCEIWDILASIKGALFEPIGMWMPKNMRKLGTGEYVQGVEVPVDYKGEIPEGCDIITLPACKMMVFQGPAYEDEHFEQAITNLWELMKTYNPKLYGFEWADEMGPRFQLAPMGYRGYIEARPVRVLNQN